MKKILSVLFAIVAVSTASYCQEAQQNGNFFYGSSVFVPAKDTVATSYLWQDKEGNQYTIILNKKTGSCYIWRQSKKTGNWYKHYMEEEVCLPICKEYNVEYRTKSK